jgi:molecular chaperone GrpE
LSEQSTEKNTQTVAAEKTEIQDNQTQARETVAAAESAEEPKETEKDRADLEREAKESYERLLRVSAEFENYKKRNAREINEFKKFANESLISELLPVVDDLERALNSTGSAEGVDSYIKEGVDLTLKAILKVFEKYGVRPIESLGKAFDPSFHQAVMQEEADEYEANTVIKELHKGYLMHERLLRPAMVVVSSAKAAQANENNENQNEN